MKFKIFALSLQSSLTKPSLQFHQSIQNTRLQQMDRKAGRSQFSLWSEVIAEEETEDVRPHPRVAVTYCRRRARGKANLNAADKAQSSEIFVRFKPSAAAGVLLNRVSWNRSLSVRGRSSIAAAAYGDCRPEKRKHTRKGRPPLPKACDLCFYDYQLFKCSSYLGNFDFGKWS